jgi:ketosteroid isomerase-like protein
LGRQAIEKQYGDIFQQLHPTNQIRTVDQVNAIGSDVWNVGEWNCIVQSPDGPSPIKGYFASITVREGDAWKIRMLAYNIAPPPAAAASPTASPSNQ